MGLPGYEVVDLSHVIQEGMFNVPGDPETKIEKVSTSKIDLYNLNFLHISERAGTHCRVPKTTDDDGQDASQVPATELVNPSVVFHCEEEASKNPDFVFGLAELKRWEDKHGRVQPGVIALLDTGWYRKWSDPDQFLQAAEDSAPTANGDGNRELTFKERSALLTKSIHYPGFSEECLQVLVQDRRVHGLGTDALTVEPGTLRKNGGSRFLAKSSFISLENLRNLDRLPSKGGIVFAGLLPIKGGSGSPSRVIALAPAMNHGMN